MEKFNLYKFNNSPISAGSASPADSLVDKAKIDVLNDQFTPRLLNYYENKRVRKNHPASFDVYLNQEPQLDFVYEDEEGYNNIRSTGRNLPQEFPNTLLQTNYFEDEYSDIYNTNEIRDYSQILKQYYEDEQRMPPSEKTTNNKRIRSKVSTKRNRPSTSLSKQRKYSKHPPTFEGNDDQKNYDPWRAIYQEGLYDNQANNRYMKSNTTSSLSGTSPKYHAIGHESTDKNDYKGYQVMANNVLYKTKSGDDLKSDTNDGKRSTVGYKNKTNVSTNTNKKLSLEDESQFAADFQQQHQYQRWGQAGRNGNGQGQYPERPSRRYDRRIPNRRQSSLFGQKTGGVYQSPFLKTFSTTSRDSYYDYEDPLPDVYDDMGDYMDNDKNTKRKIRNRKDEIEKVSNVLDYEYYGDESNHGMQMGSSNGLGFADTITRRISDAVFSPTVLTLLGLLTLPLILAAAYWLFVVNGPTPVVKARIDQLLGLKPASEGSVNEASIGFNNFVEGSEDLTYTEVAPLWDSIGKPLVNKFFTFLQKFGSVSPDVTSSSNTGGFINKTPLFSQIFGDVF